MTANSRRRQVSTPCLSATQPFAISLSDSTGKVHRIVDTARALVDGDFGPGAQRTGADGLPVDNACSRNRSRGFAIFDPMDQWCGAVEGPGAYASAAVEHARDHEHP